MCFDNPHPVFRTVYSPSKTSHFDSREMNYLESGCVHLQMIPNMSILSTFFSELCFSCVIDMIPPKKHGFLLVFHMHNSVGCVNAEFWVITSALCIR